MMTYEIRAKSVFNSNVSIIYETVCQLRLNALVSYV